MRALFIADSYWPRVGGVEVLTQSLLPRLVACGYEVLVVTDRHGELPAVDEHDGIPIRRLDFDDAIRGRDLDIMAATKEALAEIVAEFRPDVINAAFIGASLWFLPAGVPTVISFYGGGLDGFGGGGLVARALERAAWVTGMSQDVRDQIVAAVPQVAEKTSVILPGLAVPEEPPPLPDPPTPPVLVCTGRMVEGKGFDVAIDVHAEVRGRHPGTQLLLGGDGPEREALAERAGDGVTFLGWVSERDRSALLGRATLVLVPSSWREGFALVAGEAALHARPVVATNVGALPDVVQDGVTGLLVDPGDVAGTAAAVLRLLDDPDAARAMGVAARERAIARFALDRETDEWDALLRRVAA